MPPPSSVKGVKLGNTRIVEPGSFRAEDAHYPRVANAQLHPTAAQFLALTRKQIIARYCQLNPEVAPSHLERVLSHVPSHFKWAGCDLFVCGPSRRCVVVETNSCPSGQKSVPFRDGDELGGYGRLLRGAFASLTRDTTPADGVLVVMYDKNLMEASAYAAALAELAHEPVYLSEFYLTDPDPPLRWDAAGRLSVRAPLPPPAEGEAPPPVWLPARAALRYVTQKPWSRLPITPATPLLNPLLPCLAGGRNKMLAARAYAALNGRLAAGGATGLAIRTPATLVDVAKADVGGIVAAMGGCAVVKVPYGNAGQGVYTITSASEFDAFAADAHGYDKFIVQQLVGGREWGVASMGDGGGEGGGVASMSSGGEGGGVSLSFGRLYHLGTVPNKRGESFVFDVRMMVGADESGFVPIALYARRAARPLTRFAPSPATEGGARAPSPAPLEEPIGAGGSALAGAVGVVARPSRRNSSVCSAPPPPPPPGASQSWLQLGTNLSKLVDELTWSTESERLIMADARDFPALGLSIDDLIDGFIQSVLAVTAIDDMAQSLITGEGTFDVARFAALNDDAALLAELQSAGWCPPPTLDH